MLVIWRRIEEAIVIDGEIRVEVQGIKGEKVRIGVTAPEDVRVDCQEVHERKAEFAVTLSDPVFTG